MTQLTQQGLLWQLFLMVKELMPATADNTKRQTEWAESFRALEPEAAHDVDRAASAAPVPVEDEDPPPPDDDDEHPIRHAARTRKKR